MTTVIKIYTDGSARGNPGPGGYGIILEYKGHQKEISQGFRKTTNNRMELLGVIIGLESLKTTDKDVHIYSDSKYVVDSVEKGWLRSWIKKDFKGKKNKDLWQRFWQLYQHQKVTFFWIKGHAGQPENERCDALAVASSKKKDLLIDYHYEKDMAYKCHPS